MIHETCQKIAKYVIQNCHGTFWNKNVFIRLSIAIFGKRESVGLYIMLQDECFYLLYANMK